MKSLGRLKKVDVRDVWTNEATDFTPWLAQEENLGLLGDAIGLELELKAIEKNVGPYRADIVCLDTASEDLVLIENQLEKTDHSHLGQLLTYAAGLDTVTIVWIARVFTDEHRAALDWLNEITDSSINFFGLEVELWQIGDSPIAPKFNLASKPNDWIKTVSQNRQNANTELTETTQLQLEYWQSFRDYLQANNSTMKSQKPLPQHWTNFGVGRSEFHLSANVNTRESVISVNIGMTGSNKTAHYHLLLEEKEQIEKEFGASLEWYENPKKKSSSITLYNKSNPRNKDDWQNQHAWMKDTLETFHRVFSRRVKALKADDYVSDDPPEDIDET